MNDLVKSKKIYHSIEAFYPFYLREHSNCWNRCLHFLGTNTAIALIGLAAAKNSWQLLFLALLSGYTFAWVGHYLIEKNRPATFTYPLFSFLSDWLMWWQLLTFQIKFKG